MNAVLIFIGILVMLGILSSVFPSKRKKDPEFPQPFSSLQDEQDHLGELRKEKSNSFKVVEKECKTSTKDGLFGKLVPFETKLYHNVFGEGVLVRVEEGYIYVEFPGKKELKAFVFPDALGKYLFMEKPHETIRGETMLQEAETDFSDKACASGKLTRKEKGLIDTMTQSYENSHNGRKNDMKQKVTVSDKSKRRLIGNMCINCKRYGNCSGQVKGEGAWDRPTTFCPGGYLPKEIIKYDEE